MDGGMVSDSEATREDTRSPPMNTHPIDTEIPSRRESKMLILVDKVQNMAARLALLYVSTRCSNLPARPRSNIHNLNRDHRRCLTVRPSPIQEPNVNEAIGPSSNSRTTGPCMRSLFEFCRSAHRDGPFTPAREGSNDISPRTAFLPNLEQLYILFFCPWKLAHLWL